MTLPREEELDLIAERAARKTIGEFFVALGVDVSKPADILEMQRDFQHLRDWRRRIEQVQSRGYMVITGAITLAMIAALWRGFVDGIRGH